MIPLAFWIAYGIMIAIMGLQFYAIRYYQRELAKSPSAHETAIYFIANYMADAVHDKPDSFAALSQDEQLDYLRDAKEYLDQRHLIRQEKTA